MNLTVCCVLWVPEGGEWEGRKYTPAWVYRLKEAVAANLALPHRFVCLSNVDIPGVEVIPLKRNWEGWWCKVEMFDPSNDLGDRVLYLDLDVYITGDLTEIATFDLGPAKMALMPPNYVILGTKPKDKDGVHRKYQASVIVFEPPMGEAIYGAVDPLVLREFRSDQDLIGYMLPNLPTMPARWFAKLKQCDNGVPKGVKVVLAHKLDLIDRPLSQGADR